MRYLGKIDCMRIAIDAIDIMTNNLPNEMLESEKDVFDKLLTIVSNQRVDNGEIRLHISESLKQHEIRDTELVLENQRRGIRDGHCDEVSDEESSSIEGSGDDDRSFRLANTRQVQRNVTTVGHVEHLNQSSNSSIKSRN